MDTETCPRCGEPLDWGDETIALQYSTLNDEPTGFLLMHARCAAAQPNIRIHRSEG